jgi:hypothetical protein
VISGEFKIDSRFKQRLKVRYGRFEFQAGVLQNRPHLAPLSKSKGLTTLQGGPARRKSRTKAYGTVQDVGERLRKSGNDYLRAPIQKFKSPDMVAFRKAWGLLITGVTKSKSQVETAFRAVIRNPILKGAYGRNTRQTAKAKGFNRKLIDTGQFFQAIAAKVLVKRV